VIAAFAKNEVKKLNRNKKRNDFFDFILKKYFKKDNL